MCYSKHLNNYVCPITGGLVFKDDTDIGSGSIFNQSLFQKITCNETASQSRLSDCSIEEGSCVCQISIGLKCFGKRLLITQIQLLFMTHYKVIVCTSLLDTYFAMHTFIYFARTWRL